MKRGSTLFLRGVVWLLGLIILAICVFALPAGIAQEDTGYYRPLLLGLYVPAIPFFAALYQTLRLLDCIDKNKAFSQTSVATLKYIRYYAIAIATLFAAGMPYIYYVAEKDDAPGVILIGLVIIFASMVFAVFAAVLQRLLSDALAIKSENDLTV
jgi:hypothetical protein